MIKIINAFLSTVGAMSLIAGSMVIFTERDYLEILVVSGMVGMIVGLMNMLNLQEEKQ